MTLMLKLHEIEIFLSKSDPLSLEIQNVLMRSNYLRFEWNLYENV